MAKIESLTPEQWAEVHQHRDQVIERCLNQPLDHNKIGQSIGACYEAVGEEPPLAIVWAPGPVAALAWSAILRAEGEKPKARQLGGQLRDQLRGQLGGQLRVSLDPWFEAYWLGFYTAGRAIAGEPPEPRLDALTRACSLLGWWWPQHGAVVLTDRPTVIARDGQGRLHHPDGPALAWADGYALYAWHGVRVPASLVTGDGWETATILREPNTEIRRCAIERMGWDRFIPAAGLTQVGSPVPDPGNPGHELALYDVPERIYGDADVRVLLCTNGTQERDGVRRRFGLTVPADIADPLHAAAWGYDLTPEQYATAVRRA